MVNTPRAIAAVKEVVTNEILRVYGLNTQAFSGSKDPKTIWRTMVAGGYGVMSYYRELEEKDWTVGSSLEVRKLLVCGQPWNVVGADDKESRALQYKDEAAKFLRDIPSFGFVLEELLDAPAYGFAVCEITWRNDGNRIVVDRIIGRPQDHFDFREVNLLDPPTGELHFLPDQIPPGEKVPPEKFLVSSYRPRHGDRRGLPLLRRLFWPSWFKRHGLGIDLQFLEKGQGTIAVQYADGAAAEDKISAQETAEAIANEIAVAVPSSLKIMETLLTGTRRREGKDYQILIDYLDSEMTRLVLGQTLATRGSEQQRGTLALGEVHQDMLYQLVHRDAMNLSAVIDEQLLTPWLRWTFGDQALDHSYRPHFMIDIEPEQEVLEQARFLKEARGLVDVTRAEAYERLQLREPEEDEALVAQPFTPIELTGLPPADEGGFGQ